MKVVLALLLICLFQISLGEPDDVANDASSKGNLVLPRGTRDAARTCKGGDRGQKCRKEKKRTKRRKVKMSNAKKSKKAGRKGGDVEKKKSTGKLNKKKSQRKQPKKILKKLRKNRRKVNKSKKNKSKKATKRDGNVEKKKLTRKLNRKKTQRKQSNETKKMPKKKLRKGQRKGKLCWKDQRKGKIICPPPTTASTTITTTATTTATTSTSATTGIIWLNQCFKKMVVKMKKFNKAQVELRLANRIQSWGRMMNNKKNKSAFTFSDVLAAMNDATENGTSCKGNSSSLPEAKKVQQTLANCSVSAADNCDQGKLSIPINSTKVFSCKTLLEAFATDFKDCLTKSTDADICSCVEGLTNPSSDCLNFRAMHDGVKTQLEKCTKASFGGSFGDCRKQERMAAKFVNKCKQSCPGGSVSTKAPQRPASKEILLKRLLNQTFNFL